MKRILIGMIRVYQLTLSRLLWPCCRFEPTCSKYCVEAIQKHGSLRGLWLGTKRLLKCQPFHPGGYDPVPPVVTLTNSNTQCHQHMEPLGNS